MTLPLDIEGLLKRGRGCFSLATATAEGVPASRVRRLVTSGHLVRVGRGIYASTEELQTLSSWDVHAIRARAFAASCQSVWAADWSAVALRGLRHVGRAPPRPTVIKPAVNRSGTVTTPYGRIRHCRLPEEFRDDDMDSAVSAPFLAVDLARKVSRPAGLVVVDSVLAAGSTKNDLTKAYDAIRTWSGATRAAWAIQHGDAGSESALETLGRWACIERGVPLPLSNVWVGKDRPVFRVDHLWPWHWVVAEGDGAQKYRTRDPATVVRREKERQWYLEHELGLTVVRYGWDLAARHPDELGARFGTVLAAAPPRAHPVRWWTAR